MKPLKNILKLLAIGIAAVLVLVLTCYLMESRSAEEQQPEIDEVEESWGIVPVDIKEALPELAEKLNAMPLPSYMQDTSLIDVYFKYNQPVNGYEVTARWRVFEKMYETGRVMMNFYNPETGAEFQYYGEKYNSFDTDEISFAEDFKGHQRGDIHYFDYTSPDSPDPYKEYNDNSPIGYYTSFQFLDIDFDGEDELLVSDMYKGQPGNYYSVWDITKDGLNRLDSMPLDRISNIDKINLNNKTITIIDNDGAYDNAEFVFEFKERNERIEQLPKFFSVCASRFDFDKYNDELGAPFSLVSIKEYVKTDVEHRATYLVQGNRIVISN